MQFPFSAAETGAGLNYKAMTDAKFSMYQFMDQEKSILVSGILLNNYT